MLPHIRAACLYDTRREGVFAPTAPRITDCYEISIFLNDSGAMTLNNVTHSIRRGDMRFSYPGDQACSTPPICSYVLYFTFGSGLIRYDNELLSAIPPYGAQFHHLIPVFEQITALFAQRGPGSLVKQNALLLELLSHFCPGKQEKHSAVESSIAYMKAHLDTKITLERLGALTGYSPLHVHRLFCAETQCTPHEYLHALRMERARELLEKSRQSVQSIAFACGFSSESHFHTCFKKVHHETPREYRVRSQILCLERKLSI